jgi:hypothetical protein
MAGNGRSGRKRKPTELKVLQGSFRKDRHGDEAQPTGVNAGFPDAPAHLSDRERELWEDLRQKCESWAAKSDWLAFNGVVSLADRILRNQEAQRETDTAGHPLTFKHVIKHTVDGQGQPVELEIVSPEENPLISQEMKLWRELRAFIGLTGLSPADRARMRVTGAEEKKSNPLDRFIKRDPTRYASPDDALT